jgi:Zn-dependent protease with chaperone function
VDELLAAAPVLGVIVAGWWSMFPIDHRLREAALLYDLDQGRPVRAMPSRGQYVLSAVRHQAALILVPMLCLLTWSEGLERMGPWLEGVLPSWVPLEGVHIAGMIVMLAVMPVVMRWIWDTTKLGPGPLRERLERMCREQGVTVRELLVWRTHGTMINGAVMGLAGPLRYILLTDALLDYLPQAQVEAVTAHELGHIRRRHMPWLAGAALSGIVLMGVVADWALRHAGHGWSQTEWARAMVVIGSLLFGALLFGFVSRRFEGQADAFAVQHLSGYRRGGDAGVVVTPEAVSAMSGALESVARLNQIPRERFSWRHGSIASRQRRLNELVGRRADALRPDRHAAWVKIAAGLGLFLAGVVVGMSVVSSGSSVGSSGSGGGATGREAPADEVRQDARHR